MRFADQLQESLLITERAVGSKMIHQRADSPPESDRIETLAQIQGDLGRIGRYFLIPKST